MSYPRMNGKEEAEGEEYAFVRKLNSYDSAIIESFACYKLFIMEKAGSERSEWNF